MSLSTGAASDGAACRSRAWSRSRTKPTVSSSATTRRSCGRCRLILRNGAYRFATGCARALKGLGGAPVIRKKHGRQSVLLTSELFRFVENTDGASDQARLDLRLGTKSRDLGRLQFKAKKGVPFTPPKMLSISIDRLLPKSGAATRYGSVALSGWYRPEGSSAL